MRSKDAQKQLARTSLNDFKHRHCCVPPVNQRGSVGPNNEHVSFHNFPEKEDLREISIHAIRKDEGRLFHRTKTTKVCSLYFKEDDIRKGLGGRVSVKRNAFPCKFAWKSSSRKRRQPSDRLPVESKTMKFGRETHRAWKWKAWAPVWFEHLFKS